MLPLPVPGTARGQGFHPTVPLASVAAMAIPKATDVEKMAVVCFTIMGI